MNSRSYTAVNVIVCMVEDDLFGAESAKILAQDVPQITSVGVPSKSRACRIDMERTQSTYIDIGCLFTCLWSSKQADTCIVYNQPVTRLGQIGRSSQACQSQAAI